MLRSYSFTALTPEGVIIEGREVAPSKNCFHKRLKKLGLEIISIKPFWYRGRVFRSHIKAFCEAMHQLIEASVTPSKALKAAAENCASKELKNALIYCHFLQTKGVSLNESLGHYTHIFSPLFLSLVEIGEKTNTLSDIFLTLQNCLQFEIKRREQLFRSTLYPLIVCSLITFIVLVFTVTLIPEITNFYKSLGTKIPFAFTAFSHPSLLTFIFTIILVGVIRFSPFRKKINKNKETALFCFLLSHLLESKIDLVTTLRIVSSSLPKKNPFKEISKKAVLALEKGKTFSSVLKKEKLPDPFVSALQTGEAKQDFSDCFRSLALYYKKQTESVLERYVVFVKSFLVIFIGFLLFGLVYTLILPLYSNLPITGY